MFWMSNEFLLITVLSFSLCLCGTLIYKLLFCRMKRVVFVRRWCVRTVTASAWNQNVLCNTTFSLYAPHTTSGRLFFSCGWTVCRFCSLFSGNKYSQLDNIGESPLSQVATVKPLLFWKIRHLFCKMQNFGKRGRWVTSDGLEVWMWDFS